MKRGSVLYYDGPPPFWRRWARAGKSARGLAHSKTLREVRGRLDGIVMVGSVRVPCSVWAVAEFEDEGRERGRGGKVRSDVAPTVLEFLVGGLAWRSGGAAVDTSY